MSMTTTYDEEAHLGYGNRILQFHPDRSSILDDSKMPISALNAIPMAAAQVLENHHAAPRLISLLRGFRLARLATVIATLILGFFVYLWAYDLYGSGPALASSLLFVLSPNIIAHGTLVTTDLYFALGVIVSLYYFRHYLLRPTLRNACLSALMFALAQLTKPFAIYLYGVAGCFLLLLVLPNLRLTHGNLLTRKSITIYAGLLLAFFLVVLNIAFSFDRTFTPLGGYRFQSVSFMRRQSLPVLRSVPVPLPYPYLQGLDMLEKNMQDGSTFGNIYLLGQLGSHLDPSFRGFKSYYAVAFFFKEPIALQILFMLGLAWIWKNRNFSDFFFGEALLLMAAAILLVWLSFFNRAQIGIRHILPFFAVDVIIAGAAFVCLSSMSRLRKAFLCLLVFWLGVSVASYYPHMIPYMNEWVFNRRLAYKILADSNLDWGQNRRVVENFLKNNPDVIADPPTPVAGRILVRADILVGVTETTPNQMLWLRCCHEPIAQVGYANLLFVVPSSDLPHNSNGRQVPR